MCRERMGAGYVVGTDPVPLMVLSARVGGPIASVRAEAASLLWLVQDVGQRFGRQVDLLVFVDCLVLLEILKKWGTSNFHPRPREIVHFDIIRSLLIELRQWQGNIMLVKVKSHTGCLLNERADEQAELGRDAEGPEICPGPQKFGSFWLRVRPTTREFASKCRKQLPRDSAPNNSIIQKVAAANIFRSVRQRSTIFVQSLLHRTESITVSRLVRKCAPAVYRTWLKCMAGIYPVQAYLSRIGLVKSSACPHCGGAQPETLTHFACVCPAFREARTSAHNQVRQEITSYLASLARPRWIIFEETRMGATGLQLRPVSASQVVNARPDCEPVADSHGRCHLTRWQPDWLLVSSELKKIAIVDLCRPSDVHHDQLIEAATRKQHSYSPLVEALDHYSNQGWIVHVFPWVVGIRGMIDPVPIQALLEFLDVPRSQRQLAVDRTVLASVRALHFLHQVRFGGRPARAGGALNLDSNDSGDEANETVALPRVSKRKRVCTPGNASNGVIAMQMVKLNARNVRRILAASS